MLNGQQQDHPSEHVYVGLSQARTIHLNTYVFCSQVQTIQSYCAHYVFVRKKPTENIHKRYFIPQTVLLLLHWHTNEWIARTTQKLLL